MATTWDEYFFFQTSNRHKRSSWILGQLIVIESTTVNLKYSVIILTASRPSSEDQFSSNRSSDKSFEMIVQTANKSSSHSFNALTKMFPEKLTLAKKSICKAALTEFGSSQWSIRWVLELRSIDAILSNLPQLTSTKWFTTMVPLLTTFFGELLQEVTHS